MSQRVLVLTVYLSAVATAYSQTSYPMISHTNPVAVQRGKTTEITVEGTQDFTGAYLVLMEGKGVTSEIVSTGRAATKTKAKSKSPSTKTSRTPSRSVKLKVTPAADVMPGVREFRIATSLGLSSIGQIVVVDDPVILESSGNNTREKATAIAVPCVACGKIEAAEDVDYFKFTVAAGQVLTFEVQCARLQDKIHDLQKHGDPMLTLYDADGKELAANDDFYFADPLLSYRFEKSGEYYLQLRDSVYDGDARWVYALTVTDKPYVSHVFPLAVAPGKTAELEPVGSAKFLQAKAKLPVAPNTPDGLRDVQLEVGGKRTNPVAVEVSLLPQQMEQEPNDAQEKANRLAIPGCVNGRIGAKRDLDYYVFSAKKGQPIQFEVKARRFNTHLFSKLDANLDVLDVKGKVIATADDVSPLVKDPSLVFNPPADGDYLLRIRDLLSKGGEQYVYAIDAEPAVPDFTLRCDGDKAMIGPGASTAWYVHVTRQNGFAGPVTVAVDGLPKGVRVNSLIIPPTMTQGLLVLTAEKDAPIGAANVQVIGTATVKAADGKGQTLRRVAVPNEEIYLPGGGRGRFDVNMQTVAVTEQSDIEKVEVSPSAITLRPGQEVKITVKVRRHADYTENVVLDIELQHLSQIFGNPLPPGVTVVDSKSKTLIGKGSEGHIVLKAAADAAPIENVPISVLAQVSINFVVKVSYSSEVIPLTVSK